MPTRKSPIEEPRTEGLRFRRREHLKRRAEITVVFKKGRVAACPGARLFFLENGLPHNRVVFTFARNYGNAVERNRARRLGREAYRLLRPRLRGGFDLVLLVYPSETVTFAARQKQLKTLVSKAGLYRPAPV